MTSTDAMRTDGDWERLARTDAYWSVLTDDRFRQQNLDDHRELFFASGEVEIDKVFDTVRVHIDPGFAPKRVLDFGCGVGRLLIPLARRCAAVGVDVSDTMLREAAGNCRTAGADNVALVKGDDDLSAVTGTFDLVHTVIVLQHVPVDRGVRIFRRLVDLIAPGGCGALHVTYAGPPPPPPPPPPRGGRLRALAGAALRPLRHRLFGSPVPVKTGPEMQMNVENWFRT